MHPSWVKFRRLERTEKILRMLADSDNGRDDPLPKEKGRTPLARTKGGPKSSGQFEYNPRIAETSTTVGTIGAVGCVVGSVCLTFSFFPSFFLTKIFEKIFFFSNLFRFFCLFFFFFFFFFFFIFLLLLSCFFQFFDLFFQKNHSFFIFSKTFSL